MHHIISMIVYAKTKEEARSKAEEIFNENLTPSPFDYGTFFDGEILLATSKEGKKLINDDMKIIKREFMENLKLVKKMIKNYSDEELFEEKILDKNVEILNELEEKRVTGLDTPYWFKHQCWRIGKGDWLYLESEPITSSDDLKRALSKKYCNDKEAKVWVLPIDVHT